MLLVELKLESDLAKKMAEADKSKIEEIFKNIDKVTRKDILRVSKDLFKNESLNLAIIGPYKKEGRFLNLLNF